MAGNKNFSSKLCATLERPTPFVPNFGQTLDSDSPLNPKFAQLCNKLYVLGPSPFQKFQLLAKKNGLTLCGSIQTCGSWSLIFPNFYSTTLNFGLCRCSGEMISVSRRQKSAYSLSENLFLAALTLDAPSVWYRP